jgi:hypothetical protein
LHHPNLIIKADNEIYAQNYGDDFKDYVEFASENYGDGNLADTNNNNLGNTPAERQRNQMVVYRMAGFMS